MVPHAVMLQSLSTELGLSPHPGAPELLTQTWQTLDESRLFLKVLQPHSLCVIGMPSENRDTSQFLPTAPRIPPSPHRSESGVRGKRTGVGLAGSPTEPGGAGASPARELLLFTPRQADERPRSLGAQRLQGSITAITSRSQTGCRQRWGKSLFRVWLCQRDGKKCLGMRRGVKEPLLYEGQKSEGGWVRGRRAPQGQLSCSGSATEQRLGLGQPPAHSGTQEWPINSPVEIVERSKPVGGRDNL